MRVIPALSQNDTTVFVVPKSTPMYNSDSFTFIRVLTFGNFELSADKHDNHHDRDSVDPLAKKASFGQVVATMFWGMCMIGKKGTWERNGAKITLPQVIVGAAIAGCVVVALLVLLARFVAR